MQISQAPPPCHAGNSWQAAIGQPGGAVQVIGVRFAVGQRQPLSGRHHLLRRLYRVPVERESLICLFTMIGQIRMSVDHGQRQPTSSSAAAAPSSTSGMQRT